MKHEKKINAAMHRPRNWSQPVLCPSASRPSKFMQDDIHFNNFLQQKIISPCTTLSLNIKNKISFLSLIFFWPFLDFGKEQEVHQSRKIKLILKAFCFVYQFKSFLLLGAVWVTIFYPIVKIQSRF